MKKFNVNQIVKGKVCGYIIVLGYRVLNGREFVQVKPYCDKTKQALRGEMALEESVLVEVLSTEAEYRLWTRNIVRGAGA